MKHKDKVKLFKSRVTYWKNLVNVYPFSEDPNKSFWCPKENLEIAEKELAGLVKSSSL